MKELDILNKYLPQKSVEMVFEFIKKHNVFLKIVNKRITKHGDYKRNINGQHVITVNGSLNKYRFLFTLIHEFAHLVCMDRYSLHIKPHGHEWKSTFQQLMAPYIKAGVFPSDLETLVSAHMINPAASSDRDAVLSIAMKKYDQRNPNTCLIYEVPLGKVFATLSGKVFVKGKLRIKRYECKELKTGLLYTFSPNAEVKILEDFTS